MNTAKFQSANLIRTAGTLLGLGLGGLFDGIVLHQILQWHNMLSSVISPHTMRGMQINMLGDGLFDGFCWILVALGVAVLFRAGEVRAEPWSRRFFAGAFLVGFGSFNLVEGVINHHLLGLHHVRYGANQPLWDVGFLVWGALMLLGGWYLQRRVETPIKK